MSPTPFRSLAGRSLSGDAPDYAMDTAGWRTAARFRVRSRACRATQCALRESLVNLPCQIEADEHFTRLVRVLISDEGSFRARALRHRGARAVREAKREGVPVDFLLDTKGKRRPMNAQLIEANQSGNDFRDDGYRGPYVDRSSNADGKRVDAWLIRDPV